MSLEQVCVDDVDEGTSGFYPFMQDIDNTIPIM